MKKRRFSSKPRVLSCEDAVKILLTMGLTSIGAHADIPEGLIGGSTSAPDAYSAFISSTNALIPTTGLPANGQINSVALSAAGLGLIGGQDGSSNAYAVFVLSSGILTTLDLNLPGGTISSTSINLSGKGLIGGTNGSGDPYAAVVTQDGNIQVLSTPTHTFVHSTAINDSGMGLIGGEGLGANPYAAYITPDGAVIEIDTSPLSGGEFLVAINSQGNGIIGGFSNPNACAFFVSPGESPTTTALSPIPGSGGVINGVAINDSGVGLMGGYDESSNIYAGRVSLDGTVTSLFESPPIGQIFSTAINSSGVGLIGGEENSNLYAAFVEPDGTLNSLLSGSIAGSIKSVAINDAGIGLLGGEAGSQGYATLVAPNGALTPLDMSTQRNILSVALHNTPHPNITTNSVTPQSIGPYSSTFYTHLAAISTLESRFIEQNRIWIQGETSKANIAHNLVASSQENFLTQNSQVAPTVRGQSTSQKPNTIWIAPFGNYTHLKAEGSIPSYTNAIGGFLLAYDHQNSNYLVGTSVGYAFNSIDYSQGLGHSTLQEEMLSLYGAYYQDHFWFDGVLWGGLYQLSNTRNTLSIITSTASTHGWILSPHLEMASPWAIDQKDRYFIEPFFMLDWVNNWQNQFTETGAAGFNLQIGNLYSSLLQSEVGLRFYERFGYRWGNFCLEEKLSYVNQAPFHVNSTTTSFVSSASSFPIATGTTQVQNLGSAQLIGCFVPRNPSYPFGGFAIQITANGSYQSYSGNVFTGIDF